MMEQGGFRVGERDGVSRLGPFGWALPALALFLAMTGAQAATGGAAKSSPSSSSSVATPSVIRGQWEMEIDGVASPLRAGSKLPAGALLRALSEEAMVRLAFFDGRGVSIESAGGLPAPATLVLGPLTGKRLSYADRFFEAFAALLAAPRTRYMTSRSRSGQIRLHDGIFAVGGQYVDLAPIFADAVPGTFEMALQRWREDERRPWRWLETRTVRWELEGEVDFDVSGLEPGLYRLLRLDEERATADDAWILLSPSARFAEQERAFQGFAAQAPWWGGDEDEPEVRGLLRAFLHILARELEVDRPR